jgi:hypothetical protein
LSNADLSGATATSSSVYGGSLPSAAIDGSLINYWHSENEQNPRIQVKFSVHMMVSSVLVIDRTDHNLEYVFARYRVF